MRRNTRLDPPPPSRPELALVAEDHIEDGIYLRHILTRQGLIVRTAMDGLQAVKLVRAEAFDLVLMDVSMPRMDGVSAVRAIRDIERAEGRTPAYIQMTTGFGEMEDMAWSIEAGADGHMVKPLSVRAVLEVLHQARIHRGAVV